MAKQQRIDEQFKRILADREREQASEKAYDLLRIKRRFAGKPE
jgi:hypothetical protein